MISKISAVKPLPIKKEKSSDYETMSSGLEDIVGLPRKPLSIIKGEYNPKDLISKIIKAQEFRKRHHLIQPLLNTTLDFCSAGFHVEYGVTGAIKKFIKLITSGKDKTSEIKKYYDDFNRVWDMDKKVIKMLDSLITTNNCVVIGQRDLVTGEIITLKVVNPAKVEIIRTFGPKNMLLLELDDDFVTMVTKSNEYFKKKLDKTEIANILNNIPEKYKTAALSNERGVKKVLLKEEDGDFWLLKTKREQEEEGLEEPDMCAIFELLATYDLLDEADQISAFIQKALIVLVTQGETLVGKNPSDQKAGWLQKGERKELETLFKKPIKGFYVIGNHSTKVTFIHPPPELFADAKYEATRRKIFIWKGLSFALMEGTGGSYAVAWINLRKFLAEIQYYRRLVSRLLEELWSHPAVRPDFMAEDDALPKARFDEQITEEPRTLLAKVQFGVSQGILSIKTALETLGFRPRNERFNKLDEIQERGLWSRIWEPNQGLTTPANITEYLYEPEPTPPAPQKPTKKTPGEKGRPANEPVNDTQPPKPSTT
ncbi:hypothetical protein KKG41_01070 [Patescibacteria group bacterium]|nr:hypothetical protein [Patescibacteria group bacterium]MBU1871145.1 hypothetical protein [Patescibacteria group bacterium]